MGTGLLASSQRGASYSRRTGALADSTDTTSVCNCALFRVTRARAAVTSSAGSSPPTTNNLPYGSRGLSRTASTALALPGRASLAASSEPRSAKTIALPLGKSLTVTGNRTPRKSEKMPNQDDTMDAAFSTLKPGWSENTTGRVQERWPAESKNGTGNNAKSLGRDNRVPLRASSLIGLMVTHGARALLQPAQLPWS